MNTSAERSALMRKVRRHGTAPELAVRRALHRAGFRYRLNVRSLPGSPDIVLPRYRTAVFVHGCFWHGHECRAGALPSTNLPYWQKKIAENRERDERKVEQLLARGFAVFVIWTCELERGIEALLGFLTEQREAFRALAPEKPTAQPRTDPLSLE